MNPSFLFPFLPFLHFVYVSYPFFLHSFFSSLLFHSTILSFFLFLLLSFLPSLPIPTCLFFLPFSFHFISFLHLIFFCIILFLSFLPSFLPCSFILSFFIPFFHILPFRSMSHRHRGWSFCRSKTVRPPQIPSFQSDAGAMGKRENLYCIYWKASWEAASQLSWDALKGGCKN